MWNDISGYPVGHGSLLAALETFLQPPEIIILRGDAALLGGWRALAKKNIQPDRLVLAIPSEAEHLPGLLASKSAPADGVLVYPCTGTVCLPAMSDIDEFAQHLQHRAG